MNKIYSSCRCTSWVQCPTEAAHGVTSGKNEIWETFRRVIAGIRKNPVDLLFIAGDLFHRQPLLCASFDRVNDWFAANSGNQNLSYGRRPVIT